VTMIDFNVKTALAGVFIAYLAIKNIANTD
jgi:hypothetical protein